MRFFPGCAGSVWMYQWKTEKKLYRNYTKMLCAVFNKSWKQHPTKQQLYSHLLFIWQTIQVRLARHADYCWTRTSDILLWTLTYGCTRVGQLVRTYISSVKYWMQSKRPFRNNGHYRWMGRESGNSMLSAQLDDDDDYIQIVISEEIRLSWE